MLMPAPDASCIADPRAETILAIFARETGVERAALQLDATPEELGIVSLDCMLAVFEIEAHFRIELPPPNAEAGREFSTIGALLARVLALLDLTEAVRESPALAQAGNR
jgi:acyl carrier protein